MWNLPERTESQTSSDTQLFSPCGFEAFKGSWSFTAKFIIACWHFWYYMCICKLWSCYLKLKEGLAFFCKVSLKHVRHIFQQHNSVIKQFTKLLCRPVVDWKHFVHKEQGVCKLSHNAFLNYPPGGKPMLQASVRSRLCYRQNSDCFQKKKRQALQRYAVCHDSTKASQGTVGWTQAQESARPRFYHACFTWL